MEKLRHKYALSEKGAGVGAQSESGRIDALLYGRGVEESPRTRYAVPGTNGAGGKSDGAGGVYDAGHVE